MRTSKKTTSLPLETKSSVLVVAATAAFFWILPGKAADVIAPMGAPPPAVNSAAATQPQPYSAGVAEVLKMLDAKVDLQVIRSYINTSSRTYILTADHIVALKQRGVPDELLTVMIERGAEMRRTPGATPAPAEPDAQPPGNSAPVPPYAYPDKWDDSYNYVPTYVNAYTYPISPYSYWWYDYGWPFTFYTSFYFGGYWGHHWWGHSYPYYCGYRSYGDHFPYYRHYGSYPHRDGFVAWNSRASHAGARQPWAPYGTVGARSSGNRRFAAVSGGNAAPRTAMTRNNISGSPGRASIPRNNLGASLGSGAVVRNNASAFGGGVRNTAPGFGAGVRNTTPGLGAGVRNTAPGFGPGVRNTTPGFGAGVRNTTSGFGTGIRTAPMPATGFSGRGVTAHASPFTGGFRSMGSSGGRPAFSGGSFSGRSSGFTGGSFSGRSGGFGGGGFSGRSGGFSGG